MKPIKVCVYKKSSPVYVNIEKIDEAFQNCHLLIYNLTDHQKDKVLELIKSFENVTIDYIPNDTAQQEKADATKNTNP